MDNQPLDYFERLAQNLPTEDYWTRLNRKLQQPPTSQLAEVQVPATSRRAPRAKSRAYKQWSSEQVAEWRHQRHLEQRRGQRDRWRVSTGRKPGRRTKPAVPHPQIVEGLLGPWTGVNPSGGQALRTRALLALVAGGGLTGSQALALHTSELEQLKMPAFAWQPITQIMLARRHRGIPDTAPLLCCFRTGSVGLPWRRTEMERALNLLVRRFNPDVSYGLDGFRLAHEEIANHYPLLRMPGPRTGGWRGT